MPRPREFDTEILLEKVLLIFLENGLQRTSMRQLEATTGVKQVSLYNAYDNKEGLFLAVFDRYAGLSSAVQDEFLDSRGVPPKGTDKLTYRLVRFSVYAQLMWSPHISNAPLRLG